MGPHDKGTIIVHEVNAVESSAMRWNRRQDITCYSLEWCKLRKSRERDTTDGPACKHEYSGQCCGIWCLNSHTKPGGPFEQYYML